MAMEIERKFLVKGNPWQELDTQGTLIQQGYLSTEARCVVRVRLCAPMPIGSERTAFITIKSKSTDISSHEYEYPIPPEEAEFILKTLTEQRVVEKIRYRIPYAQAIWDVDEFLGANAGLTTAEIELNAENESVTLPPWVGQEVTHEKRYKNALLTLTPFSSW